jgi:hypothetical protein
MSGSVDAVEVAAEALAAGLKRLQAAKGVERRREIASDDVGKLVGKLDAAMPPLAASRTSAHCSMWCGIRRSGMRSAYS